MRFVVEILTSKEITDYKVFERYKDAYDRYRVALLHHITQEKPVRSQDGQIVYVWEARLYRIDTEDPREAKTKIEDGEYDELLEDSENEGDPIDLSDLRI